jgi:hypothetical protein
LTSTQYPIDQADMKKHVDVFNKLIRRFIHPSTSLGTSSWSLTSHWLDSFQIQVLAKNLRRERSYRLTSVHQQVWRSWPRETSLLSGPVHLYRFD